MKTLYFYGVSLALLLTLTNCGERAKSPEELKFELKEKEKSFPLSYLTLETNLSSNEVMTRAAGLFREAEFSQNGWNLKSDIVCTSSVAQFKDIKIEVEFISKTGSVIETQTITKYEYIKPGQKISFTDIISGPSEKLVDSYKSRIIEAKAAN